MKAAFMEGPKDVKVDEFDDLVPNKDEALIKVNLCGVCPSDLKYYFGHKEYIPYGRKSRGLTGHEWTGEIIEIGEEVTKFEVGDEIIPYVIIPCGECKYCKMDKTNLCANKDNNMGGYAELATVKEQYLFRKPESISQKEAAITEPLSVCLNGNKRANIEKADDVVVIGAGPIGLIHLQLSKLSGARVIVSDLVEGRLELAGELGADKLINVKEEDAVSEVKDLTDGYGADSVIVATGNKTAIEQSIEMASDAATVNLFAGTYPPIEIKIDPNRIHYSELILTGSYDATAPLYHKAFKLMEDKKVEVERLFSHVFPLEEIETAYKTVAEQGGLKIAVSPKGLSESP